MALYFPDIFSVSGMKRAREIILTPEGTGADTETRWAHETPYVRDLIRAQLDIGATDVVLDYGCGIGRLAKALIEATGCAVIGVDISPSMRALADEYVASSRFVALSPEQFDILVAAGLRASAAIAVWVLQHCFAPSDDIERIRRSLMPRSGCFVLNMRGRAIPAMRDDAEGGGFAWASDGADVQALLRAAFDLRAQGVPGPAEVASGDVEWLSLRARAS